MKAYLQQIFDYNYHCNRKIIEACSEMETVPESIRKRFSHILNAHHIWNARILEQPREYEVWQLHDPTRWQEVHYQNQRDSFEVISQAADLGRRVAYETTDGRSFSNSLQDILFHIVNHSTHHRGQISVDFRTHGLEPLPLDYIHYKR